MHGRWLKYGLVGIAVVVGVSIVFGAGFLVGRQTESLPGLRAFRFGPAFLGGSHGAVGSITKIDGGTVTLRLRDGALQTIRVDGKTRIERNRRNATSANLNVGDQVVVIGSPDVQGSITARYMRVVTTNAGSAP
jgi:translation initiation factor IF-1